MAKKFVELLLSAWNLGLLILSPLVFRASLFLYFSLLPGGCGEVSDLMGLCLFELLFFLPLRLEAIGVCGKVW